MESPSTTPDTPAAQPARPAQPARRRWFTTGSVWNAFKTFAIVFSFFVNFVLIIALLLILPQLTRFYEPLRNDVLSPIVGGLYTGFGDLNAATIQREIAVKDTVPAVFNLPLDQTTTVELVEPVPLVLPAVVDLGGTNQLDATVYLSLPPGTKLPVHMNMVVPVSQTIPVDLTVAVNIPLSETQLGPQFQGFQRIFSPLNDAVDQMPDTWEGVVKCVEKGGMLIDCKRKQ